MSERLHNILKLEIEFLKQSGLENGIPIRIIVKASNAFPESIIKECDALDAGMVSKFHDFATFACANRILQSHGTYRKHKADAERVLTDAELQDSDVISWIFSFAQQIDSRRLSHIPLSELSACFQQLTECVEVLTELQRISNEIKLSEIGNPRSIRDLRRMHAILVTCCEAPLNASDKLCYPLTLPGVTAPMQSARSEAQALTLQREILGKIFAFGDVPSSEAIKEHRTSLRATGGSIFSYFYSDFRNTRLSVLGYLISRDSFTFPEIISNLGDLEEWINSEKLFRENELYSKAFGSSFNGLNTNWDELGTLVRWCQEMTSYSLSFEVIELVVQGEKRLALRALGEALTIALRRLDQLTETCSEILGGALENGAMDDIELDQAPSLFATWNEWLKVGVSTTKEHVRSDGFSFNEIKAAAASALSSSQCLADIEADSEFKMRFGTDAGGIIGDWEKIDQCLKWCRSILDFGYSEEFCKWIFSIEFKDRTDLFFRILRNAANEFTETNNILSKIESFGTLDREWLCGGRNSSWSERCQTLDERKKSFDLLAHWIIYQKLLADAEALKVQLLPEYAIKGKFPVERMSDVYDLAVTEAYGFEVMNSHPKLSDFAHQSHESIRKSFASTDRKLLKLNQLAVAANASNRSVPRGVGVGAVGDWTENALLKREIEKRRRHISIRQLMKRASTAIRALKPCIMMSPLSVANYLDPFLEKFDLIVMDEASQIRPEDSLGAIARGKQLVVVGDTKQMPPSDFWQASLAEEEDEEEDASAAQTSESVLECALHAFSPVYRLKWHYRSQHQDLIKFSNHYYYDDELIVFPATGASKSRQGVFFNYLPDATLLKRRNNQEAQRVAEAAVKQLIEHPEESLLVATMNLPQQELIEEWIDQITEKDAIARKAVEEARSRAVEEFSVKNLENIQGHQRDVVFISMTYGKDPESKRVLQRFGPVNGKNGRRRLNVLFSRSKLRIEVFSSMTYQDIVGAPGQESGVNDLRNYLRFAQEGVLYEEGEVDGRAPDSEFEVAVINMIHSVGLVAIPQVGVASYRIDIGVCHPDRPGEFILGIECDGATYHSSRSARDRDRLREEVLLSRGWKLYRIWSTDWFRQQEAAKSRLLQTLLDASGKQTQNGS